MPFLAIKNIAGQAKSVHILVKEIILLSKNVHGGGGGGGGQKCVIFERTSNSLYLSLVLLCITILFNYVRFQGRGIDTRYLHVGVIRLPAYSIKLFFNFC